jgi:hypothetical protein
VKNALRPLTEFEKMVIDLRKLVKTMNRDDKDERRLFYLLRAYELVVVRNYEGAISSAMSDQCKLSGGGGFPLAVENMLYMQDAGNGVTKQLALRTIERILGKPGRT